MDVKSYALLLAIGLMASCASFDSPFIVRGNSACAGPNVTPGRCKVLDRQAASLHTPEMLSAICAAGADTLECRK